MFGSRKKLSFEGNQGRFGGLERLHTSGWIARVGKNRRPDLSTGPPVSGFPCTCAGLNALCRPWPRVSGHGSWRSTRSIPSHPMGEEPLADCDPRGPEPAPQQHGADPGLRSGIRWRSSDRRVSIRPRGPGDSGIGPRIPSPLSQRMYSRAIDGCPGRLGFLQKLQVSTNEVGSVCE